MKNTKRILSLVLCCLMLLSFACSAASYSDVPADHERFQAIDMLSSMDIITGFPDGTFKPDEAVTRAQMAALITRMFNLSSSAVTAQPFSDVAVDYWAAANIVAAKNMNIINGFPDGTFQPEVSVTYEQAVKMIVCALNYGTAAEAMGGYPAGYIQQASKLNVLKNAVHPNTEPSPRGIIAQLLYNSLDVEMLVPQVNPDGTVDYVKQSGGGNTINQQIQKTQKLTNVTVVRTPRVNLEPGVSEIQSVNDNAMYVKTSAGKYVKIIVKSEEDFAFIGQNVDITYKEDTKVSEDKTLTNITRNGGVRAYENIKLSHVVSLNAAGMTYYTDIENEKTTNITFNGSAPTVLYNERLHQNGITVINDDLFNVTNHTYATGVISVYVAGNSTLVKAKSYKTYVADSSYDSSTETIKLKGGVVGGVEQNTITMTIPTKDTYINETIIKKGTFDYATGKAGSNDTTQSSIAKGNMVSIAYNNQDSTSTYYEVLVSSTTLSGGITERTTDDETRQPLVKIGSSTQSYVMSKDLERYELNNVLTDDSTAKFYVDAFNRIGYFDNHKAGDIRMGIPVSVAVGGSGLEKETKLTIYNVANGKLENLFFKDEVANDSRVAALKESGTGKLIRDSIFKYTIKSGKIDTLEALQAGTTDYTYVAENSTAVKVTDIKKSSNNKITFDTNKSITYRSASDKIIVVSDSEDVAPKTASMTNNANYEGKVYQLNNKVSATSSTNIQYIIVYPLSDFLNTSPTYIVESIGSDIKEGELNYRVLNVYPFHSAPNANTQPTPLKIASNVATSLNLDKGDVFTYYDVPTAAGYDIDKLDHVYIFAKAEQIAKGNYPTSGIMNKASHNVSAANGYTNDYRYFGVYYQSVGLVSTAGKYVYAYYMGTPLEFSGDGESILRMAIDKTNNQPILPHANDAAYFADIPGKLQDGAYYNEYNTANINAIYVYDASAKESDKLKIIAEKEKVQEYLGNLKTMERGQNDANAKYDTLILKTYHDDTNALNNLYIIKDAQAASQSGQ